MELQSDKNLFKFFSHNSKIEGQQGAATYAMVNMGLYKDIARSRQKVPVNNKIKCYYFY